MEFYIHTLWFYTKVLFGFYLRWDCFETKYLLTMSAVAALTLKEPIIPIVSSFEPGNLRTIKVEHRWTTALE